MTNIQNPNRNGVIPTVESEQYYPEHYLDDDPDTADIQQTVESLAGTDFSIQPDKTKEVQQLIVDRQEIDAVGRQLAATLDVSNSRVSRVIDAASETVIRTVFVNGNQPSKLCNVHQYRSRLRLWLPSYPETGAYQVAIGRDQNIQFDTSVNMWPTNAVVIMGPIAATSAAIVPYVVHEFRTVRELWALAEDTIDDLEIPICIVEEFVS